MASALRRRRLIARAGVVTAIGALAVSLTATATAAAHPAAKPGAKPAASRPAYLDPSLPIPQRVHDLLGRMTLAEKVGQMTQAERGAIDTKRADITDFKLGSLLSGGGSTPAQNNPKAWADMIDAYQSYALKTRLHIPLIYGIDSVHGHGNLYGATLIPHNIGLGSTRDPGLVRAAEHMVATETRATGIPWVFAPCVCVARDDRWGRTYESFGEDPSLVIRMETAIDGFQGTRASDLKRSDHVLATVKHFAGDGDTTFGSGRDPAGAHSSNYPIDQGITQQSWQHFSRIDLAPYVPAVRQHHVGSVMPSYSSVDFTNDRLGNPIKMHAERALIQGWLKNHVGFDGFVISDYNGLEQIPLPTFAQQVDAFVNAGGDMAMEPNNYAKFATTLISEVKAGHVSMARINDAVSRILTEKFALGLFEHPYANRTHINEIGDGAHRAIARRAAAESQVLLKNTNGALPLARNARIYVAGRNADNLGNQAGGWTITWQGETGTWTKGTTILRGMRQVAPHAQITYSKTASAPMAGYDVGVVVVGETPYSEGFGDVGGPQWAYDPVDKNVPREPKTMQLKATDRAVIDKVCSTLPKCVVLVVSGRPQIVTSQLKEMDALVASWLPGTEGEGVADALFGVRPFSGQLSQSWPRWAAQEPISVGDRNYRPLFPFGWGLTTNVRGPEHTTEPADIRALRLRAERHVANPGSGVPAGAAALLAQADVATLRGAYRTARSLYWQVINEH